MTPLLVRISPGLLLALVILPLVAYGFSTDEPKYSAASVRPSAKQLFTKHCVSCHGRDGRATTSKGKFSHARDIADAKWHDDVTDERIFNSIMNGRNVRGNMPAFSDKFTEAQVNSLVAFVRGLRQ